MALDGEQRWALGTNIVPHTFAMGTEIIAVGIRIGGAICWDSIDAVSVWEDGFGDPTTDIVVPLDRIRKMLKTRPNVAA